jgi:hypothetical protein
MGSRNRDETGHVGGWIHEENDKIPVRTRPTTMENDDDQREIRGVVVLGCDFYHHHHPHTCLPVPVRNFIETTRGNVSTRFSLSLVLGHNIQGCL